MKKAFENFIARIIGGLFGIIIDLFVASLFIFSTTILAVSSLVCLALDCPTFAMLFRIALLPLTLPKYKVRSNNHLLERLSSKIHCIALHCIVMESIKKMLIFTQKEVQGEFKL